MTSFTINEGYSSSETVAAEYYRLEDGYFNFYDTDGGQVFSLTEKKVISVTRDIEKTR